MVHHAPHPGRELFVNVPVADLPRSMAFFRELGFVFDTRFTDERAACMLVGAQASVMLLDPAFFRTFTPRNLCATAEAIEAIIAFSCEDRREVDALTERAIALGAREALPAVDYGFMYFRRFFDLDGHQWEPLWMRPASESPCSA